MNEPAAIPEVDASEAARMADDDAVLLLDVREHDEWDAGHAPQAVHSPLGALDPADLPAGRPVVTVCRSGRRSGEAARLLASAGRDVRNLTGGMESWAGAGLPVTDVHGSPGQII